MVSVILKNIRMYLLLFPLTLLLLYCDDPERIRDDRYRREQTDNEPIRTSGTDGYYGRYSRIEYSGPSCQGIKHEDDNERYEQCINTCKEVYGRDSRDCEKLPLTLISDLDDLFKVMTHIRLGNDGLRGVSDFQFGVMIDISLEPARTLISIWSVREVTEFLLWTAKTPSVALALVEHDKQSDILRDAFEKLGEDAGSGGSHLEYGIGTNLEGFGRTFWAVAETEKNIPAFVAMHHLLKDICQSKNCKLGIYCGREEFERAHRRTQQCHYSNDRQRFGLNHCYVHGPDVWSYWQQLNDKREFGDADFPKDTVLNADVCDNICKKTNCRRD